MNEFRQLDVKAVAIMLLRLFIPWSKSLARYKLQRNYWRCWFSFLRLIVGKWKCWWAYKRQHVTCGKVLSLLHLPMRIWKSWAKLNLIFIRKVSKSLFKIKLLSSNVFTWYYIRDNLHKSFVRVSPAHTKTLTWLKLFEIYEPQNLFGFDTRLNTINV